MAVGTEFDTVRAPTTAPRSPARLFRGQPAWVLPALTVILALALTLYAWRLGASGFSTYYASSAKSMATSPRAFLFGALDPGSTWTLDKLSGFLVPQSFAVMAFGLHAWALDLPQVVEGLVTVVASYAIGTRWRGPVVGILAAGVMAVTPMLAAMFGRPMEDGMLTMSMVLAFGAWQRALLSGRVRWLLLSASWVAIGFQAKMMQAWLILPALLIGYLVGGPGSRADRLRRTLLLGAVAGMLSIAWITAIQLVPAGQRPFVDGTTDNNAFSMVFGYNGIDRILPGLLHGGVPQLTTHVAAAANTTATQDAGHSVLKLVLPEFTTQIGWLYPAAALGMAVALTTAIRRRRTGVRPTSDGTTALGLAIWLGVNVAVLSAAFVPHATYFAVLALPLALFAVTGAVSAVRAYGCSGFARFLLPGLVAAQGLWGLAVGVSSAPGTRIVGIVIAVVGAAGVVLLLLGARRGGPSAAAGTPSRRLRNSAMAVGLAAAMIGPVVWSSFVVFPGGGGSASDAYAGPREQPRAVSPVHTAPRSTTSAFPEAAMLSYVRAHGAGSTLFATDTLAIAVAVNLSDGGEVLPMGGFSRQAPWPTSGALSADVATHRLRFVLLEQPDPSTPPNPVLDRTRAWTRSHCAPVLQGRFRASSRTVQVLYDCGG